MAKQIFNTVNQEYDYANNQIGIRGDENIVLPIKTNVGSSMSTPLGRYGVGDTKYDEDITLNELIYGGPNFVEATRASNQGIGSEFVGFLNQAIIGEVIGGTLEGLGYLLDLNSYKQLVTDTEDDFSNIFSDLGKSLKTWSQEKTPIYTNPNDPSFNPGKSEWWFKNGVSVASTVSILIPAIGAVKGLSMLGKGLKAGKLLSKLGKSSKLISSISKSLGGEAGQLAARGVSQAVISRHLESMMEASQTYQELYEKYLLTMSEEEARKAASEAASQVYDRNWVMLIQDIPQYLLMNKVFLGKSIIDGARVSAKMGKGVGGVAKSVGKKITPYIQDSIGEGFEEMYQYIVQQEAEYMMDKRLDKAVESTFGDRLNSYLKDGEMWTSFTMGMLGSGVQQSVGPVINNVINKIKDPSYKSTEDRKMDDISGWTATFRHANDVYKEFAESGYEDAFETARDMLIANIAEKSASLGNFHNVVEFFEQLSKGDSETLANFGLTEEDVKLVTEDSNKVLSDLNRFSEIYDSVEKRFKKGIIKKQSQIAPLARLEFEREKLISSRDVTSSKLEESLNEIKDFDKLSMNTQDNILISRKLKANQKLLSLQNKFLEKSKNKREQDLIKSKIKKVEDEINSLKEDLTENVESRTSEDEKQDKPININEKYYYDIDSLLENLVTKEQRLKEIDARIKKFENSNGTIASEKEINDYEDKQNSEKESEDLNKPKENDLVSYTDLKTGEIKGAIVKSIDKEDELLYEIETIDEEGNGTGETMIVPMSSLNLEVDLNEIDGDAIESENTIDPKRYDSIKDRIPKNYVILPYSYGNPRSKEFKVFDTKLSAFISDPENNLNEAKAVYEIDASRMLSDKTLDEKIVKKIMSGRKLTISEINSILKDSKNNFTHFLSNVPIKINLISKDDNRSSSLYLYKGKTAEENSFRYKILLNLLQGKEVWTDNVKKTNSGNVNSGHSDILISELGIDINTAELGIVLNDLTGGILKEREGSEHPIGTGNVGNVFLFTDLTPNKKGHSFPIKLNVQKISKEHAEIIWDAFKIAYTSGNNGLNSTFPENDPRVKGDLSIADILNYLVNWGVNKTSFNKKGRLVELKEHLKSKQLYYEKGVLYYGENSIKLHSATKEQKAHFIEWAMNNKNYKISIDTSKTDLNKVDSRIFKIGSIETDGKTRYATTVMKSGMVKTDVRKVKNEKGEEVNSIFKDPLLIVSTQDKDLKSSNTLKYTKPVNKQKITTIKEKKVVNEKVKKEVKEEVRQDAIPTTKESRQVKRIELGDNVISNPDQVKSLPAGVDLYYEIEEYDDEDNKYSRKVIVGSIVLRNGKKIFLNKSRNDKLTLIHQMNVNSDKVANLLMNIFDGVGHMNTLKADVELVAKPASKETKVESTKTIEEQKVDIEKRRQIDLNKSFKNKITAILDKLNLGFLNKDINFKIFKKEIFSAGTIIGGYYSSRDNTLALLAESNITETIHELIHKHIFDSNLSDKQLEKVLARVNGLRKTVKIFINQLSEKDVSVWTLDRMFDSKTVPHEEVATYFLTEAKLREALKKYKLYDRVYSIVKEVTGFSDVEMDKLISLDLSTESENFSDLAEINSKYDAELASLEETTTEQTQEDTDDIGFGEFEAKPTRMLNEVPKEYIEQDYEKEIKKWLRSRLGKDTSNLIKLSDKLIEIVESGATAWGIYSHNAIELYKRAEEGTIYHEGWHRVSYAYFSPEERKKVYDRARIKYNMLDSTDSQIEERLAEEFRDYVLANEKADSILELVKTYGSEEQAAIEIFRKLDGSKSLNSIRSEIDRAKEVKESKKRGLMQIISDIYEFIRSIFIGKTRLKTYEIDKIFASINRGKYKYAKIRKENLNNLKGYSAPRLNIKLGELDEVNTSDQVRSIVKGLTAMLINSNDIQNLNDIKAKDIKFRPLINQLKIAVENFKKQGTEKFNNLTRLYTEVISDLEKPKSIYRELLTDYLTLMNIRKNSNEVDLMEDNEDNVQDTGIEQHNRASYEINGKNNILATIKFLIATLPESDKRDEFTHMYSYADFSYTWNSLLRDLSSIDTIEEMIDVLNSFKDNYTYSQLAKKLEDTEKPGNQILRSQFESAIRQHRHSFLNVIMKNVSKSIEISKADLNAAIRIQRNIWSQSFFLSKYVNKPENEKATLNIKEFDVIVNTYKIISRKIKNDLATGSINEEERKKYIKATIGLLNEIGITIDEETIDYYLHDKENMNQALVDFIQKDLSFLFKYNRDRMLSDNPKTGIPLNNVYGGNFSTMVKLSEMYVNAHPDLIDDSVLGPKNNLYYTYSLNSLVTDLIRNIKKDNTYLSKLSEKEYSKHSIIIDQILKDPDSKNKINLYTFSGLFAPSKAGNDYMEMSPVDDYITKLALSSKDYVLFPTMADKKTYYVIDGIKMPDIRINIDSLQTDIKNKYTINKEAEDILYGYYKDELSRIKKALKQKDDYLKLVNRYNKTTSEKQKNIIKSEIMSIHKNMIEHYNFKKISDYKDNNGFFTEKALNLGNALYFSNFSSLNSMEIEKGKDKGLPDLSWHTEENIRKHINLEISTQIYKELEYSIKQGVIKRDPNNGTLSSHVFDLKTINKYGKNYGSFNNGAIGLIGEYTVKNIISNIELEKIMSGDPAFFKSGKYNESFNDKVKRLSGLTSTGNKIRESVPGFGKDLESTTYTAAVMNTQTFMSYIYNKMLDNYTRLLIERYKELHEDLSESEISALAKKDAKIMLKAYTEVDATNAQVYITPELYRSINIRLGEWSDSKQEAFDLLTSDKELTVEEEQKSLNIVMSPLKLTHYGFTYTNNLSIPVYDKMSLAPIFRRIAKGSQIEELLDRMEASGKYEGLDKIGMIKADTAVKSGATDGFDFYTNKERTEINEDLSEITYITQEFKYLRRQLVTDPHDSETATIGTQFLKIAMSNIFKDKKIYDIEGLGKVTGESLIDIINSSLSRLSTIGQKRLSNKLGFNVESGLITDKSKFLNFLKKEANQANLEDNLALALREDENGDFYMNLDSLPNRKWIESRIISLVNKHVVNRTMPGKQLIQMSNFGIRDKKIDNSLKFIDLDVEGNKIKAMEAKVSINVFKDLIPNYSEKTFDEKVKYLLDNDLDVIVGYRIPTQGLSSIVAMKVVQFLPEQYGDTISLPEEFTALTGSDFDIDKLFVIRHNYKLNKKGNLTKVKFLQGTSESEYKERYNLKAWEEYKLNKHLFEDELIENLNEINNRLYSNEYKNETEQASDYTKRNEILNQIIDILKEENILPSLNKFKTLDIVEQNTESAIQNRLLSSYISILTNANHYIEATSPLGFLGLELKKYHSIVTKNEESNDRLTSFAALTPSYNHTVKFNNSGGKTGVGPFALSKAHHVLSQIVELKHISGDDLGRMYGDDNILISEWLSILIDKHVDIAKDPMIMGLNVNTQTYDVVNYMIRAGYGGEKTFMFSSQPILKEYANQLMNAKSYSFPKNEDKVISDLKEKLYNKVKELSELTSDVEIDKKVRLLLPDTLNTDKLISRISKKEELKLNDYLFDLAVLENFKDINEKGNDLFELVMASRVDTRKWGKNLVDVKAFINSAHRVLSNRKFNTEALTKIIPPFIVEGGSVIDYNNTFVANYFINAVLYTRRLLSPLTIYSTTGFDYMITEILNGSGNKNTIDRTLINKVSDELFSSIISRFFVENKEMKSSKLRNLLLEKDNIIAKVANIKNNPDKYPDLQDNKLIKYIIPVFKDNDIVPNYFRISTVRLEDKWEKDEIVRSWKDLLTHSDKDIRSIGYNLLAYSFYTTGFRYRSNGFSNLIPVELLKEIGFDTFIKTTLEEYKNMSSPDLLIKFNDIISDVFENNSDLNSLVPTIKKEDISELKLDIDDNNTLFAIIANKNKKLIVGKEKGSGEPIYLKYVKYNIGDTNKNRLFKYIGNIGANSNGVYIAVDSKGYEAKGIVLKEYGLKDTILDSNKTNLNIEENRMIDMVEAYAKDKVRIPSSEWSTNEEFENEEEGFTDYEEVEQKELSADTENIDPTKEIPTVFDPIVVPTKKIISGGQTGIDRLGLEIGKSLGLITGGTSTPGFYTQDGRDESLKDFGVEEISNELQGGKKGREFYLPRTEENAKNSDGTVYFTENRNSGGLIATRRYANKYNKPFILNPNITKLKKWLVINNIETLNVAGSRGSNVTDEFKSKVTDILKSTLKAPIMTVETIEAPEGFAEITDEVMKKINDKFGDTYTKEQVESMSESEKINILNCL